jgi:hypothetical protein
MTGMADDRPEGAPAAVDRPHSAAVWPPAAQVGPGWYPDPWSPAHHRYWNGASWTGDAFPHGPTTQARRDATSAGGFAPAQAGPPATGEYGWYRPPPSLARETPPPPQWSPPAPAGGPAPWPAPTTPMATTPARSAGLPSGAGFVALVVAVMVVVGSLGVIGGYYAFAKRARSSPVATGPSPQLPTTPPGPTDPAASALSGLVVTQADVDPAITVGPRPAGNRVAGEATLDLCNGNFASEALRTARLQVDALDTQGSIVLSTEAVLYSTPGATTQAFSELTAAVAACPDTPVVSPVGESTRTTHFNAVPDGGWPQVATVERLAYDFVTTDDLGISDHSVAVYLRRGRVLMGLYFSQPDAPAAVAGQSTLAGITNVFATRMAQLAGSVVNG